MVKIFKGIPYSGTLPATLTGTKAGYLHSYKIYGNTEQTGTPTPENPIEPQECGERTENLANDSVTKNYTIDDTTGQPIPATSTTMKYWCMTQPINVVNADTICLSVFNYSRTMFWKYTVDDGNGNVLSKDSGLANGAIVRIRATGFMRIAIYVYNASETYMDDAINSLMLTEDSTPPTTYIPYGYKLPLLSGSTPVDIYFGESQTTRRIKKLVLTGNEDIGYDSAYTRFSLKLPNCLLINVRRTPAFCTHYEVIDDGRAISNVPDNSMYSHNTESRWYIKTTDYSTADAFKAFLAQQYANGTPVTVWYVLATEETGILNEPLRKIGDYADTIDSTQTSAQIPTSADSTTISWAGQGLAPSQFDSIQEWVDTPTYKRVNGEWVADN